MFTYPPLSSMLAPTWTLYLHRICHVFTYKMPNYEVLCDCNLISKYDGVQRLAPLLLKWSSFLISVQRLFAPWCSWGAETSMSYNVSAGTSVNSVLHVIFEVMVGSVKLLFHVVWSCMWNYIASHPRGHDSVHHMRTSNLTCLYLFSNIICAMLFVDAISSPVLPSLHFQGR